MTGDVGVLSIPIQYLLAVGTAMFAIGVVGVLVRRNILVVFMSLELMLNGVNINFVAFSHKLQTLDGQIFAIFIITVAAAEAAVGLAILVSVYRRRRTTCIDHLNLMKW